MRIVLATNVLVSAFRSRRGASFRLVQMIGPDARFTLSVSVPLVLEYEMVLEQKTGLTREEAAAVVDYLCLSADHRRINFLWRPFLRDPCDEMVLEVAVVSQADYILTYNTRDFGGVEEQFGIGVIGPAAFLEELEALEE